jgi:hypothetical protein
MATQADQETQRDQLRSWLSLPDPSEYHNLVRRASYAGIGNWFLQSMSFKEWKSKGSLSWIHGKRIYVLLPTDRLLMVSRFHSGVGQKRPLVRFP